MLRLLLPFLFVLLSGFAMAAEDPPVAEAEGPAASAVLEAAQAVLRNAPSRGQPAERARWLAATCAEQTATPVLRALAERAWAEDLLATPAGDRAAALAHFTRAVEHLCTALAADALPALVQSRDDCLLAHARELPLGQRAALLAPVLAGEAVLHDPEHQALARSLCLEDGDAALWEVFIAHPTTEAGQAAGWRWLAQETERPLDELFSVEALLPEDWPASGIVRLRQRLADFTKAVADTAWSTAGHLLDKRLRQRCGWDASTPSEGLLRLAGDAILPLTFPEKDEAAEAVTWRVFRLPIADAADVLRQAIDEDPRPRPDTEAVVTRDRLQAQPDRQLRLPGPGFYQIEASSAQHLAVRRVIAGDLQAQCSAGPAGLAVLVADRRGFPVANAEVAAQLAVGVSSAGADSWRVRFPSDLPWADRGQLFSLDPASREQRQALARRLVGGRTDAGGCVLLPLPMPGGAQDLVWSLAVVAGPEVLVSRGAWTPVGDGRHTAAYVHADRSLYRPGETAHLRGVVRRFQAGVEIPSAGLSYALQLHINGERFASLPVSTGEFGTFAVDLPLAPTLALGACTWQLTDPGTATEDAPAYRRSRGPSWNGGSLFRVEEFRLPDLTIAVVEERTVVSDGSLTLALQASYLSGAPAAGISGRVREVVGTDRDHRVVPFTTDAEGRIVLVYKDYYVSYQTALVAEVADASNRVASCIYYYAPHEARQAKALLVRPDHALVSLAEGIAVEVQRRDGGDPPDLPVELRLLRLVPGVSGSVIEQNVPLLLRAGGARHRFAVREPGEYRVEAVGAGGTGTGTSGNITVQAPDIAPGRSVEVKIEATDGRRWRLGETAELRVAGPAGLAVLATVSGRSRSRVEVLRLEGGIATLRVPLDADCVPGAEVVLASAAGDRVRELRRVLPVQDLGDLRVELTPDATDYRPGQGGSCTIRVSTADGQPVEGEVAIGVVDQAVFELERDPAPTLSTFAIPQPSSLVELVRGSACDDPAAALAELFTSGGLLKGRRLGEGVFGSRSGGGRRRAVGRGGGSRGSESALPRVRRDFRPTAYWHPAVRTDVLGEARIDFALPDSLTAWRLCARVVARDRRAGEAMVMVRTNQPVALRADLPCLLRRGDRIDIQVVVANDENADLEAAVGFTPGALQCPTAIAGLTVAVPAGARLPALFPATVPADAPLGPTTLGFTLSRADGPGDALEIPLQIADPGEPQRFVQSGRCSSTKAEIALPALDGGSREGRLLLSGGPGGAVVDALAYLKGFPYGCTEQTLNRFLPALAAEAAFTKAGLPAAPWRGDVAELTTTGIARLAWLRHPGAGWGWWRDDADDLEMTAEVAFGLAEVAALRGEAGLPATPAIDLAPWLADRDLLAALRGEEAPLAGEAAAVRAEVLARYRQALPYRRSLDRGALLLLAYAQARRGAWKPGHLAAWCAGRGPWPSAGERALVALTQWWSGDRAAAAVIFAQALATTPPAASCWLDDPVVSAAWHLRALCVLKPQAEELDRAYATLSGLRRSGGWASTRHTAIAVLALADYVAQRRAPAPASGWRVLLDGRELAAGRFDAEPRRTEVVLPAAALERGGALVVEATGGSLDWDLACTWHGRPAAALAAAPGPLRVERRYRRVIRGEFGERLLQDLAPGDAIAAGDRIAVELALDAASELARVLIEDPRCPGLEPVMSRSGQRHGAADNLELRDDRLAFFVSVLPRGRTVIAYEALAERSGAFHVPAVRAECMYDPAVAARGAAVDLVVQPRPAGEAAPAGRIAVDELVLRKQTEALIAALTLADGPHRRERLLRLLDLQGSSWAEHDSDPVIRFLCAGLPGLPDDLLLEAQVWPRLLPAWAGCLRIEDAAGLQRLLALPLTAEQLELAIERFRWIEDRWFWIDRVLTRLVAAPGSPHDGALLTLLARLLPAQRVVPSLLALTDPGQRLVLAGLLGSGDRLSGLLSASYAKAADSPTSAYLQECDRLAAELAATSSAEWRFRLLGLLPGLQTALQGYSYGEEKQLRQAALQRWQELCFDLRLRVASERERERLDTLLRGFLTESTASVDLTLLVPRIQALSEAEQRRRVQTLFAGRLLPPQWPLLPTWYQAEPEPAVRAALLALVATTQLEHYMPAEAEREALHTWLRERLPVETDAGLRRAALERLAAGASPADLPALTELPRDASELAVLVQGLTGWNNASAEQRGLLQQRCRAALDQPGLSPTAMRNLWTRLTSDQQQVGIALLLRIVAAHAGEDQSPGEELVAQVEARPASDGPAICALLDRPDRLLRWLATAWLAHHPEARILARLRSQLAAPGELTRYAVALIGRLGEPAAVARLTATLEAEESPVGQRVLLAACGEGGDAAVLRGLLEPRLRQRNLPARHRVPALFRLAQRLPATEVLASFAAVITEDEAVALLAGLGAREPERALAAVLAAWHQGRCAATGQTWWSLPGLRDGPQDLRGLLLARLATLDDAAAYRLLRSLDREADDLTRLRGLDLVADLPDARALPLLREALTDPSPWVRRRAASALDARGEAASWSDEDGRRQRGSGLPTALRRQASAGGLPVLRAALVDADPVRRAAAAALWWERLGERCWFADPVGISRRYAPWEALRLALSCTPDDE